MTPAPLVFAAGAGAAPVVRGFDAATGAKAFEVTAYAPTFSGGLSVTAADLNADGVPDLATAPGPGGGPHVKAFSGATGRPLAGPVVRSTRTTRRSSAG